MGRMVGRIEGISVVSTISLGLPSISITATIVTIVAVIRVLRSFAEVSERYPCG